MNLLATFRSILRRLPPPADQRRRAEVLWHLRAGPLTGRDLRNRLWAAGEFTTAPGFYRFMASQEKLGYVRGWYEPKTIDGQEIRIRWYVRVEPTEPDDGS
jgi:hypothetical protein